MDCLFCQIAEGKIPASIEYQDEKVIAFKDINPQAPIHTLIIPRQHISTINDLTLQDMPHIAYMMEAVKILAQKYKVSEEGYRLVMNCNAGAGQTVFHIHMHLLGGRPLTWPPG